MENTAKRNNRNNVTDIKRVKKTKKQYNLFQRIVRGTVFGIKNHASEIISTILVSGAFISNKIFTPASATTLTWIGISQFAVGSFLVAYGFNKNKGKAMLLGLANIAFLVLDLYIRANR